MNSLFHKNLSQLVAAVAAGSAVLVGAIALPGEAIATRSTAVHVAQASTIQTTSAQNGTLYLNNDRIYSYNLEVEDDTRINGIYVPAGAVIQGRYEPAEGGLRYVARSVIIGDRSYNIYATSRVLEDEKDPRDISAGSIAEDAGIGAVGGAILGEITGEIDAGEVIGGAAAGAATGNITADRVVVVEPGQPIYLFTQ